MLLEESRKQNIGFFLLIFPLISLFCSLGGVLCGASVLSCLKFAGYQTLLIFFPGLALATLLTGDRDQNGVQFVCLSYALGYAVQILLYFLTAATGFSFAVSCVVITGLLAFSGAVLARNHFCRIIRSRSETAAVSALLALFLILVFFAYSARHALPGIGGDSAVYHADALYWIENAAALTKSFPPAELRMSGTRLYYHYFASAALAFCNRITGIDVFSLGYAFYPLGKCLILFGGIYELAAVFFQDTKKRFFFLLVLLFSTGLEKYSIANYVAHIITLPFGFDIGYGFGAFFLAFLIRQYQDRQFNGKDCFLTVLFFLMCAGHKAPIALVYLLLGGILCLFWLLKKQPGKALINGVLLIASFLFVMIVCVGFMNGDESRVNAGSFSHVATLRASPLFDIYEEVATHRAPGVPGVITVLLLYFKQMLLFCLSIHPLLLLLLFNGVFVCFKGKKTDILDIALLATMGFGLFMGLFNAQEGVSQLYYTLASYIPGAVFGFRHLQIEKGRNQQIVSVAAIVLFGIQCSWFFGTCGTAADFKTGVQTVFSNTVVQRNQIQPYSIQKTDYDALLWIRENTPKDSVLAADRSVLCELDNYMYYGTFSERQMYLEGDRYFYGTHVDERAHRRDALSEAYLQNDSKAVAKLKNEGVTYIIQTKWVTPDFAGPDCMKVFETDSINVWEIIP